MKTSQIPYYLLASLCLAFGILFIITIFLIPHHEIDRDFLKNTLIMTMTLCLAFGIEAVLFKK